MPFTNNKSQVLALLAAITASIVIGFIWVWLFFSEQTGDIALNIKGNNLILDTAGLAIAISFQFFLAFQFIQVSYTILRQSSFWTMALQIPIILVYLVVVNQLLQKNGIHFNMDKSELLDAVMQLLQFVPAIFLVPLVCVVILFLVIRDKTTVK